MKLSIVQIGQLDDHEKDEAEFQSSEIESRLSVSGEMFLGVGLTLFDVNL
jgi:hypothetical protein